jgi:nitroreductase/NAD-dependent dihydropyrimidine dehydrogenase PreA subunit
MAAVHAIDSATCVGCNICVEVCPQQILQIETAGPPSFRADRISVCDHCGHRMAICPAGAVQIPGLAIERDFFDLPADQPDPSSIRDFLAARRSIRVFEDRPVPHDLLEKIVDEISLAPAGFAKHKTKVTVVRDRPVLARAASIMAAFYQELEKALEDPAVAKFIEAQMPSATFVSLRDEVLPAIGPGLEATKEGTYDVILRGAPVLMLFHADRLSPDHYDDTIIALTYGTLAAHSLGLGVTIIGLVAPAVEKTLELRRLFQIPESDEVLAALVAGYPKYRFQKGIRRYLAGVNWV